MATSGSQKLSSTIHAHKAKAAMTTAIQKIVALTGCLGISISADWPVAPLIPLITCSSWVGSVNGFPTALAICFWNNAATKSSTASNREILLSGAFIGDRWRNFPFLTSENVRVFVIGRPHQPDTIAQTHLHRFMKRPILLTACLAAMALFTSCIQQEEKLTVNADGTTKFSVKVHLNTGKLTNLAKMGDPSAKTDLPTGKDLILSVMAGSEGVDVWSDAKFIADDGENIHATLTGYARDINRLKLGSAMAVLNKPKKGPDGKEEKPNIPPVLGTTTISKKQGTQWSLSMESPLTAPPQVKGVRPKGPEPKDDELKLKIAGEKVQFQVALGLAATGMKDMTTTRTYEVAGKITNKGAFNSTDDHTASITLETLKAAQAGFDVGTSDLKAVKDALKNGEKIADAIKYTDLKKSDTERALMKSLFEKEGKLQLIITPGPPLFDFMAEAKEALANQSAELKALIKEAALKKSQTAK